MTTEEILKTFASLYYKGDDRRAPDERRRSQFHVGWADALAKGENYADHTLRRLTWRNCGYRFGKLCGPQSLTTIDTAYDVLAESWKSLFAATQEQGGSAVPTSQEYVKAFNRLTDISADQVNILRLHYHAQDRTLTARQLARSMGHRHYGVANSFYGRLGRLVGEQLDFNPMKERLGTLVTFDKRCGEWHWLMRPEVAEAIESLGWVDGIGQLMAEEIFVNDALFEGAACRVWVNAYERNLEARRRCIEHHGATCGICGFDSEGCMVK